MSEHDWTLIAPWWNWPRPGQATRGRGTRPTLHKYDTSELVDTFLADPQRRLRFLDTVDRVVEYDGATLATSTARATARRKLFQPSHFRHYLVVCSLHCDAPGLPHVDTAKVCQQGFVIRKRSLTASDADAAAARPKLAAVNAARRTLTSIDSHIAAARGAPNISGVRLAALQVRRDATRTLLESARGELRDWAAAAAISRSLKGWVSSPNAGEGKWSDTAELPEEITEDFFPLYPLIPPAGDVDHDAAGHTIYFGLVPTASADHEASPERGPRFDDHAAYEIRCFVRRHAPNCPTTDRSSRADCRGQLVWSEPTESFGLAGHFDVRGTANRPISVQMPDLRALKAHAGQFPAGAQFHSPPFSTVTGDGPTNSGSQICSFSIPLLTIVAMFVFQLFLPIVVLAFQLWFLLLLKFCVPPEIELAGGLGGALDLDAGAVDVDANFDAKIASGLDAALGLFGPAKDLAGDTDPHYAATFNGRPRKERWSLLRRLYGKDVMAQPIDDRVYEDRIEWPGGGAAMTPGAETSLGFRLGTGVAFPIVATGEGRVTWLSGPDLVRQSILLILDCDPGERIMRPTFGAGLRRHLMAPNTAVIRAEIAEDVETALGQWEPRIEVREVSVTPDEDPAIVRISVAYAHVRDDSPATLDLAFDLGAGTR